MEGRPRLHEPLLSARERSREQIRLGDCIDGPVFRVRRVEMGTRVATSSK